MEPTSPHSHSPARPARTRRRRAGAVSALAALALAAIGPAALASEAELKRPPGDYGLLYVALVVCGVGLATSLLLWRHVASQPVHNSMAEVSRLIYSTCKAYLLQQGKFLILLEILAGAVVAAYFGPLRGFPVSAVAIVLVASVLGIAGSYAVAWLGIRVNTLANSRSAFAALRGRALPVLSIPLAAGMSIGLALIAVELVMMVGIMLWVPEDYMGACFVGFAIGESLGASALRIAGGIFTKIADIGADLMKIVFNIKEDDARNPGVIADCVGDNAGDSVGPTADGFETYGVTGVALITFILLAVPATSSQVALLVWMFMIRAAMLIASAVSYAAVAAWCKKTYGAVTHLDFEKPLTALVWITSIVSIAVTFIISAIMLPAERVGGDATVWWKLSAIVSFGTLAGAMIPEIVKAFTSTRSGHVREIVTSSREGGASLNVLSGLIAGDFSAYWMGVVVICLMSGALYVSSLELQSLALAPSVFAFALVAFGFLGMGPVTIAVDSYGPVSDNAQSVYELAQVETLPNFREEVKRDFGFDPDFTTAKRLLEENDGAGNTFKATAKPVLLGTAVVGATTLIFSIVLVLTEGLKPELLQKLSILHPPFLLGLLAGGAVIHWFSGAACQAVSTGAYRAVEFIKKNINLNTASDRASDEDSRRVVEICTSYAQKGTFNIFLAVFCSTIAFACLDPFYFVGYLISIAIFGLFRAAAMANTGGAWDNAKKVVEVELQAKGTPLHAATVVGDTVGDPYKDTSSVAMNPVIKFTTLFGLLAVEVAIHLSDPVRYTTAAFFLIGSLVFVWRSFYRMRIPAAVK